METWASGSPRLGKVCSMGHMSLSKGGASGDKGSSKRRSRSWRSHPETERHGRERTEPVEAMSTRDQGNGNWQGRKPPKRSMARGRRVDFMEPRQMPRATRASKEVLRMERDSGVEQESGAYKLVTSDRTVLSSQM